MGQNFGAQIVENLVAHFGSSSNKCPEDFFGLFNDYSRGGLVLRGVRRILKMELLPPIF